MLFVCFVRKQMDYKWNSTWNFIFTHSTMHVSKLVCRFSRLSKWEYFWLSTAWMLNTFMIYQLFETSHNSRTRSIYLIRITMYSYKIVFYIHILKRIIITISAFWCAITLYVILRNKIFAHINVYLGKS